jgi:hypothetical protein
LLFASHDNAPFIFVADIQLRILVFVKTPDVFVWHLAVAQYGSFVIDVHDRSHDPETNPSLMLAAFAMLPNSGR